MVSFERGRVGGRRLATIALQVGLATVSATAVIVATIGHLKGTGGFLYDFKGDLYRAGGAILHGRDPYRPGFLEALAAAKRAGAVVSPTFALPVYPLPSLLAVAPFALLPYLPAGVLFLILMTLAMIWGLRLLGVRDWRCIVLALASWPFVFGMDVGAIGPAIVLGMGIAWHYRAKLWTPALAIASVVLAKLFPWTLLVWLSVTRRWRTLALALAIGTVAVLGSWAVIGFAGLAEYPRMLANLSFVERGSGISLTTGLIAAGVSGGVAEIVALIAAALLLAVAYRLARRPDGERQAFGLIVIAALTASPIVWPHYLVLLFVPIALASPGLSAIWFVPLIAVGLPVSEHPHSFLEVALWLSLEVTVTAHLLRSRAAGGRPARVQPARRDPEAMSQPARDRLSPVGHA
jgi:glycosyl transferase family 87